MNGIVGKACANLRAMLCQRGPMQIHFSDLKNLVAEHDCGNPTLENCWAGFGRADGAERAREVVDEALASPLFEDGRVWSHGTAVIASLSGGSDLSMGEFQGVVEYLKQEMPVELPVLAGTIMESDESGRLSLTLLVTGQSHAGVETEIKKKASQEFEFEAKAAAAEKTEDDQPVPQAPVAKRRAAAVTPVKITAEDEDMFESNADREQERTTAQKYFAQQEELALDKKIGRGRFEKSAPTILNGQDLDQPTYLRRNIKIRL